MHVINCFAKKTNTKNIINENSVSKFSEDRICFISIISFSAIIRESYVNLELILCLLTTSNASSPFWCCVFNFEMFKHGKLLNSQSSKRKAHSIELGNWLRTRKIATNIFMFSSHITDDYFSPFLCFQLCKSVTQFNVVLLKNTERKRASNWH